jgi:hypothetical protein
MRTQIPVDQGRRTSNRETGLFSLYSFKQFFTPFQLAIARILHFDPVARRLLVTLYGESFLLQTMPSKSILTIFSNSKRPSSST